MKAKDLIELLKNTCHPEDEVEVYTGYDPEFGQGFYNDDLVLEEVEDSGRYDSESDCYVKSWNLI